MSFPAIVSPLPKERDKNLYILPKTPKQNFLIDLITPLKNFKCLLPSALDFALKLYLASPERIFTCEKANIKPKIKILDAKLIIECILLKPNLLQVNLQPIRMSGQYVCHLQTDKHINFNKF